MVFKRSGPAISALGRAASPGGGGGGYKPGDVVLFENDPGPGWLAEDALATWSPEMEEVLHVEVPFALPYVSTDVAAQSIAYNGVDKYMMVGRLARYAIAGSDFVFGPPAAVPLLAGSAIIQHVAYGNSTWVICAEGTNLFTRDDGATWAHTSTSLGQVTRLIFANGVFTVTSSNGVFHSVDGEVWTRVNTYNAFQGILCTDDGVYFAWLSTAIHKSTDNGATFAVVNTVGANITIKCAAWRVGYLIVGCQQVISSKATGRFWLSGDDGDTWLDKAFAIAYNSDDRIPLGVVGRGGGFFFCGRDGRNVFVDFNGNEFARQNTYLNDRISAWNVGPYIVTLSGGGVSSLAYAPVEMRGFPIVQKPVGKHNWKAYTKL